MPLPRASCKEGTRQETDEGSGCTMHQGDHEREIAGGGIRHGDYEWHEATCEGACRCQDGTDRSRTPTVDGWTFFNQVRLLHGIFVIG